tara:strand:- start:9961 stop:10122 length:162 start_codon:yes stop_codon:yes gene_type:complete
MFELFIFIGYICISTGLVKIGSKILNRDIIEEQKYEEVELLSDYDKLYLKVSK